MLATAGVTACTRSGLELLLKLFEGSAAAGAHVWVVCWKSCAQLGAAVRGSLRCILLTITDK